MNKLLLLAVVLVVLVTVCHAHTRGSRKGQHDDRRGNDHRPVGKRRGRRLRGQGRMTRYPWYQNGCRFASHCEETILQCKYGPLLDPVCPYSGCPCKRHPYETTIDTRSCPHSYGHCPPCRHGVETDIYGCALPGCRCKPPTCHPRHCPNTCPNGYKKDHYGCDTCECEAYHCPVLYCPLTCAHGLKKDYRGCDICECKPAQCPVYFHCPACPYGYKTDSNGCTTCECKNYVCPAHFSCHKHCPNGYKKNQHSCLTCECQCSTHTCLIHCPYGYVYDGNGCQTCQCRHAPY